jgi:hypothetical protein
MTLLASRHDVCHTTTAIRSSSSVLFPRTETTTVCASPGFSDLTGYFLVIAVLLLPDAKSIGIGGFKFERLTRDIERQTAEIAKLSQQVTTIAQNSQVFNLAVGVAGLASEAAQGDVAEGSQQREEVLGEFLDPGSQEPTRGST